MKQFWLWLPLKSRLLCQILPNYNLSFPQLLSLPGRGIAIEQVFVHSEGNDNVEQQVGWQDHQNFHLLFGFPVDLHQGQVGCGVFKLVLSSKRMSQKDFFVYRISSYKALPRIIPAFLIMPAPDTHLLKTFQNEAFYLFFIGEYQFRQGQLQICSRP